METETRFIINSALGIILFGIFSSAVIGDATATDALTTNIGSWACTAELEVCPDGSYVGRVPPYCHYAECPN